LDSARVVYELVEVWQVVEIDSVLQELVISIEIHQSFVQQQVAKNIQVRNSLLKSNEILRLVPSLGQLIPNIRLIRCTPLKRVDFVTVSSTENGTPSVLVSQRSVQ
jgi:hypothetical protein